MNLAKFPRRRYTSGRTPLEALPRLTEALGGPNIFIKRDDMLGLAGGGNKTRKLEFLVADALAKGADTLITCGAIQSNHCRLTLGAAVKEGLKCRLVLEEKIPGTYDPGASGNIFLYNLMSAENIKVVPAETDLMDEMKSQAEELESMGRKAYLIPVGGSNPIGTTGYAACAQEILAQTFDMGLDIGHIITTSGSAGTQAGLVTGLHGLSADIPVIGISVANDKQFQESLVHELANDTAKHIGIKTEIPKDAVAVFDEYIGPGYSVPTPGMAEAVKLLAGTEGILLDPVYTGKAMAGLIDLVRKNYFDKNSNLLFLHTGGSPALYVYRDYILKE